MFVWVLDTSLGDVDENSSCKNLSLFQAKPLLYRSFSVNLYVRICLFTSAKFQGKLFLEIPENFGILWEATVNTNLSLSGFLELLMVTCIAIAKIMELTFPSII